MSQGQQSLRKTPNSTVWNALSQGKGELVLRGSKGINLKENCPQVSYLRWSKWTWMQEDGGSACARGSGWVCSHAGKRNSDVHEAWCAGVGWGLKWWTDCSWGIQLYFNFKEDKRITQGWDHLRVSIALKGSPPTLHVKGTFATKPKYLVRDLWVLEGANSILGRTLTPHPQNTQVQPLKS